MTTTPNERPSPSPGQYTNPLQPVLFEVKRTIVGQDVLLERMATLPGAFKLNGLRGKQILRAAVRDLLPREIMVRRKKGFSLPLGRWMREDLATMARDLLTDRTARARGLFEPAAIARLLDEHRAGVNHGDRLWNLLVLELWFRDAIDGTPSVGATA